jgi:nucleoside-diphosphate-sugar epimerase
MREKIKWEPKMKLRDGVKLTYDWIAKQVAAHRK